MISTIDINLVVLNELYFPRPESLISGSARHRGASEDGSSLTCERSPIEAQRSVESESKLLADGSTTSGQITILDQMIAEVARSKIQLIVASFPVDDSRLDQEDKTLLNKKVTYGITSQEDSIAHLLLLGRNPLYRTVFDAKKARIISFPKSDLRLYDSTVKRIVTKVIMNNFGLDSIYLSGKKVDFPLESDFKNRLANFDYVVVTDLLGSNSVKIEIVERSQPGASIPKNLVYFVDLNSPVDIGGAKGFKATTAQPSTDQLISAEQDKRFELVIPPIFNPKRERNYKITLWGEFARSLLCFL